jgi:hypothetical protein
MLVEVDQVAMPAELWHRVLAGDPIACTEVRALIDGLHLSMHALSIPPEWREAPIVLVTLRELEGANLLAGVLLQADKRP